MQFIREKNINYNEKMKGKFIVPNRVVDQFVVVG
jgi:hypothetical protein